LLRPLSISRNFRSAKDYLPPAHIRIQPLPLNLIAANVHTET
jgi:hypothetical protein